MRVALVGSTNLPGGKVFMFRGTNNSRQAIVYDASFEPKDISGRTQMSFLRSGQTLAGETFTFPVDAPDGSLLASEIFTP